MEPKAVLYVFQLADVASKNRITHSLKNQVMTDKSKANKDSALQGEGDYEAAKRFQEAQHEFAKSGKVEEKAKKAAKDQENKK
jgi:hypothetical protein